MRSLPVSIAPAPSAAQFEDEVTKTKINPKPRGSTTTKKKRKKKKQADTPIFQIQGGKLTTIDHIKVNKNTGTAGQKTKKRPANNSNQTKARKHVGDGGGVVVKKKKMSTTTSVATRATISETIDLVKTPLRSNRRAQRQPEQISWVRTANEGSREAAPVPIIDATIPQRRAPKKLNRTSGTSKQRTTRKKKPRPFPKTVGTIPPPPSPRSKERMKRKSALMAKGSTTNCGSALFHYEPMETMVVARTTTLPTRVDPVAPKKVAPKKKKNPQSSDNNKTKAAQVGYEIDNNEHGSMSSGNINKTATLSGNPRPKKKKKKRATPNVDPTDPPRIHTSLSNNQRDEVSSNPSIRPFRTKKVQFGSTGGPSGHVNRAFNPNVEYDSRPEFAYHGNDHDEEMGLLHASPGRLSDEEDEDERDTELPSSLAARPKYSVSVYDHDRHVHAQDTDMSQLTLEIKTNLCHWTNLVLVAIGLAALTVFFIGCLAFLATQ